MTMTLAGDIVRRVEPKRTLAEDIEANQREPWDWADHEALAVLALRHVVSDDAPLSSVTEGGYITPGAVAKALDDVKFFRLEDEQFRTQVAERIRRIAG